jgi:uncharacterized membrane protein YcfT
MVLASTPSKRRRDIAMTNQTAPNRIDWVDYSKGICIILVVMMHSVLGYGEMVHAEGWMHPVVEFAKPFRMPDFFLIAGLFLSRSIMGDGRSYFDRKIVHFAYFYLLWLAIQTVLFEVPLLLSDPLGFATLFLKALIIPNGSLWFVHMLAVFYAITWAVRHVSKPVIFAIAALLQIIFAVGVIDTGWSVTNRFAEWYVFFFAGYAFAPAIFEFATRIATNTRVALEALLLWAILNYMAVQGGVSGLPVFGLVLGFAGAAAIIAVGALLAKHGLGGALRYAGKYSIVIYLTFFIPMKIAQKGFSMTEIIPDVGTASALVLVAGVVLPLIGHRLIKNTPLIALYERPPWAKMSAAKLKTHTKTALLKG